MACSIGAYINIGIQKYTFDMFDKLHEFTEKEESAEINKPELVNLISEHIQSLLDQFNFYFCD